LFTGLITEVGTLIDIEGSGDCYALKIKADEILKDINIGDSVSTNGICLTVTYYDRDSFKVDVMPKTLELTSLKALKQGSPLNLEPALTLNTRLGGHLVSGHVDTIGTIRGIERNHNAILISIYINNLDERLVIPQGSVTIDGISLTIAELTNDTITVSIIPHTLDNTNLYSKGIGDTVNIEYDIIGKYISRHMMGIKPTENESNIDYSFLEKNNFL
jgi:riboflavin synthase